MRTACEWKWPGQQTDRHVGMVWYVRSRSERWVGRSTVDDDVVRSLLLLAALNVGSCMRPAGAAGRPAGRPDSTVYVWCVSVYTVQLLPLSRRHASSIAAMRMYDGDVAVPLPQ
jgi:nitrate reductase gamma subunit